MYKNISKMEEFFRAQRSAEPEWSPGLNAWVVMNQDQVGKILRSRFFDVVEHKKVVQAYAHNFGLELDELSSVLDYVPLSQNGQPHSEVRRKVAVQIQERSARAVAAFQMAASDLLEKALVPNSSIDMCKQVFVPLTVKMLTALTDIPRKR